MQKLLIILMLSIAFVFSANDQTNFVGKYEFYEDGGKTAGETPVFVGHSLEIAADGGAKLTADGFQTARDLICLAKTEGSKVSIYFTLYNTDGANSSDYNMDVLLLTLEYKMVNGKKVLWTTWGKYQPAIVVAKKTGGVYFKKSKG